MQGLQEVSPENPASFKICAITLESKYTLHFEMYPVHMTDKASIGGTAGAGSGIGGSGHGRIALTMVITPKEG